MPVYLTGVFMAKIHGVNGFEGLALAIIAQAAQDATGKDPDLRRDALAYFDSELYSFHLDSLGLDAHLLPEGVHFSQKNLKKR